MTVLKGDLATKQSKTLIRLFKSMKDYIIENKDILPYNEIRSLQLDVKEVKSEIKDIKTNYNNVKNDLNKVMDNFIDPSTYKHFLILDGKKLEADVAYKKIFSMAKKSIYYIDDYIGLKTLKLLSFTRKDVSITIFSDNKSSNYMKKYMIDDFIKEHKTNKLLLKKTCNKYHDRYIIIDHNSKNETIYHCGSSCKDAGNKISTITKIEANELYKPMINKLIKMPILKLEK